MEKPNRIPLRILMAENDLLARDVAEIVDRVQASVHQWVSQTGVDIPDELLEKLRDNINEKSH